MEIRYENDYTEEELQLIDEEKRQLIWKCRDKQKRAHKLLWDFVEHNIQKWWD